MLTKVAEHHKEWIKVVEKLGGKDYSEDIVQECYLKLHKYASYHKCIVNGQVNKYYIYLTLRSILYSYFRERKKILKFDIDDFEIEDEISNLQDETEYNEFCLKTDNTLKDVHWFHKRIYDIYTGVDKTSFRKMEKDLDISWVSIYHSVKICKDKIRENLKQDYEQIRQKKQSL